MPALPKLCFTLTIPLFVQFGCGAKGDSEIYRNTSFYEFTQPKVIELPVSLDEISGITYYAKDTSIFAIEDENGLLYKIPLKDPDAMRTLRFDGKNDFEDVVLHDSLFYVLVSNGDIDKVRFLNDKISVEKINFPNASRSVNEFESLYFDPPTGKIVMMCKDCAEDRRKQISSFSLNDSTKGYDFFSSIDAAVIWKKLGVSKAHIKPSAAAVNPVTKALYILCSVNKLLLIMTPQGDLSDAIMLNPEIYKQPEGMAFTPEGDLVISNEAGGGKKQSATLLLLKNKKHS